MLCSLQQALQALHALDPQDALWQASDLQEQLVGVTDTTTTTTTNNNGHTNNNNNNNNNTRSARSRVRNDTVRTTAVPPTPTPTQAQQQHRYNNQRPLSAWIEQRVSFQEYPDPTEFGWMDLHR